MAPYVPPPTMLSASDLPDDAAVGLDVWQQDHPGFDLSEHVLIRWGNAESFEMECVECRPSQVHVAECRCVIFGRFTRTWCLIDSRLLEVTL